ncbi:MAG: hypothetical protein U1E55_05090 [Paracoccus sp. (in: a-proteobacteria)]
MRATHHLSSWLDNFSALASRVCLDRDHQRRLGLWRHVPERG